MLRELWRLVNGHGHNARHLVEHSEVETSKMRETLEDLVSEDVLSHVYGNWYVTCSVDTEDERKEQIKKIREKRSQLQEKVNTRTKVTVGGELMGETEFRTEREPSEVIE